MNEEQTMNSFEKIFSNDEFLLIVSLPKHGVDWAQAAQDNGADAIKVHTSIEHPASGVKFGSLDEEGPKFEAMRKILNIPFGVVPGIGVNIEEQEITRMADIGFDFFDAFISQISPLILNEKRLAPMFCILPYHTLEQAVHTSRLSRVVCMEADIVEHDGYGKRASVEDFVGYRILTESISTPLVVPTQRMLRPEEVPLLADVGVAALMIGTVVTGNTIEGVAKTTKAFRKVIDEINKK